MFPVIPHIQFKNTLRLSPPLQRIFHKKDKGINHIILCAKEESKNMIYIGKIKEITQGSNLLNANLWLDISGPKIILIFGKRGSGKSYDLGVICEGLNSNPGKIKIGSYRPPVIIFDPLNQFWTLSEKPTNENEVEKRQSALLQKWGLNASALDNVKIFIPRGTPKRHPDAKEFTINIASMDLNDWCGFFKVDKYSDAIGQLLSSAYRKVTKEGYVSGGNKISPKKTYSIQDLINCIQSDDEINDKEKGFSRQTIRAVLSRLYELSSMPLFQSKYDINIKDIFSPGQTSVFMLREVDENTRSVIISLIIKKIIQHRGIRWENEEIAKKLLSKSKMKNISPEKAEEYKEKAAKLLEEAKEKGIEAGWVIIDVAHTVCPNQGTSAAKEVLIEYAKQGRCMGLSLAAATQQPSALSSRLISQRDIIIAHQLGIKSDIDVAISQMNPNFPQKIIEGRKEIKQNVPYIIFNSLEKGEAIVSTDDSSRNFIIKVRPRITLHGGNEPIFI